MDLTPSESPPPESVRESGSPDVGQIDAAALAERPRTHADAGRTGFAVAVPRDVWDRLLMHAYSTTEVEVGGVLLGTAYRDAQGQAYLRIEGTIPALAAESKAANVTFTADAWSRIHEAIERDHPGAQIVGWYHTHPNFGIFLSEMDVFIQRHFFDLPHQVAIVVDPVAITHGCFAWHDGTPAEQPLFIEDSAGPPDPLQQPDPPQGRGLDSEQWAALIGLLLLVGAIACAVILLVRSTPSVQPA